MTSKLYSVPNRMSRLLYVPRTCGRGDGRKRSLPSWLRRLQIDHIRTSHRHDPSLPTEIEQCVGLVPCKYSREGWWIRGSSRSPPLRAGIEAEVEISLIVRKMASLSLRDSH